MHEKSGREPEKRKPKDAFWTPMPNSLTRRAPEQGPEPEGQKTPALMRGWSSGRKNAASARREVSEDGARASTGKSGVNKKARGCAKQKGLS